MKNLFYSFILYAVLIQCLPPGIEASEIQPDFSRKRYAPGDPIIIEYRIQTSKPPTEFLLSEIRGPSLHNLEKTNSRIETSLSEGGGVLCTFILHCKAMSPGEASLKDMNFVFMDSSGKKETLVAAPVHLKILSRLQKYLPWGIAFLGMLLSFLGFSFFKTFLKKKQRALRLREERIVFKRNKIEAEQKASEAFKQTGKFLIAGEYPEYCHALYEVLLDYFKTLHNKIPGDLPLQMSYKILKEYLTPESRKKYEQWIHLMEEILYTGKRPLSQDLDRILLLARELIADHREHFEIQEGELE